MRCKAQEEELTVLRTKVTELLASNYNLMGRAATSTQILAARDGVKDSSSSNKGNLVGFGRPVESLEEEVNVLRKDKVEMELELKRVNAALRAEQNMSQHRLQALSEIKSKYENITKDNVKKSSDEDDTTSLYQGIEKSVKEATTSIDSRNSIMENVSLDLNQSPSVSTNSLFLTNLFHLFLDTFAKANRTLVLCST